MKLLIVDDEELTRTGVISSIDWKALNIDEVIQADDGINGLEAARIHNPEIILCDVRMPRMDGIAMLEKLEQILPDTVPIFMSGYSDKEYLKAAIKLKAVNYIEKPLNPAEIREAIQEASEAYRQKLRTHRGETLHSMETASRLALALATPYRFSETVIRELSQELSLHMGSDTCFTALIAKIDNEQDFSAPAIDEIYQNICTYLANFHLQCIYAEKKVQYLVYFVFGPSMPQEATIELIRSYISSQYQAYHRFHITAGGTFTGVSKAYQSYESAVILQQSSFFFPNGSFLSSSLLNTRKPKSHSPLPEFPESLSSF